MRSQREVWGRTLVEQARTDWRTVVIDADLATSTQASLMAAELPGSFIQAGIAEANMVAMAAGMATLGYRPWLSTFGVFLTSRSLDQIRVSVSQTALPVRMAGSYAGLLNGASGKTHQDLLDLAIMRGMPNLAVLAPADEHELQAMLTWSTGFDGPLYLRLARDAVPPVFGPDHEFRPGLPEVLAPAAPVVLVSTGVQTSRVAQARDLLADRGVVTGHVHVPCLSPLDEAALWAELGPADLVVAVEEHSVHGGLGGLVAEVVAGHGHGPRVGRIGLEGWSESAPADYLLDAYGLSPAKVAAQVLALAS